MLIMAVSGAAVLALVCWAVLRESAPGHFIPQTTSERHVGEGEGELAGGRGSQGEGERQRAGGRGSQGEGERQRAGGRGSHGEGEPECDANTTPSRPLAGTVTVQPDALHNTYADADTEQALAAAAALWNVMTQERHE